MVGRAEAASYGVFMATIMGGSVVLYLAATPFIYNEDFAWSIPLTVGSLFALLGVLERPSRGRVIASGVLILCCQSRPDPVRLGLLHSSLPRRGMVRAGARWSSQPAVGHPTGGRRRRPVPRRAVWSPTPSSVFPIGLPMADQVWATVNAHRRYFLAANGGKAFSFAFLPSTLWAYLQPVGIRLGGIFPFINSASSSGRMARRRGPRPDLPHGQLHRHQPATPSPGLLGRGDRLPATGDRAGAVDPDHPDRSRRRGGRCPALGLHLTAVPRRPDAIFHHRRRYRPDRRVAPPGEPLATPQITRARHHRHRRRLLRRCERGHRGVPRWRLDDGPDRAVSSPRRSHSASSSLADSVRRGPTLPYWAPAGQLFVMSNCSGLYLSTGRRPEGRPRSTA